MVEAIPLAEIFTSGKWNGRRFNEPIPPRINMQFLYLLVLLGPSFNATSIYKSNVDKYVGKRSKFYYRQAL